MAHIVYIITKLELGGAQKVALSLLDNVSSTPDGASLISGSEGVLVDQTKKFSSVFLLPTMQREIKTFGIIQDIKTFFSMVSILRALKKKHGQIIVHTHSTKAGIIGRWSALFAGIRHRIHTIHGYGFHDRQSWTIWLIIYLVEYITFFITTHAVCVSEHDRHTGMRLFHRFEQKSSVIHAAVGSMTFLPATTTNMPAPPHTFIIGAVACFKPQKNLIDLLKAFHHVVHSSPISTPHLMIMGDGVQRSIIETWIKEHKLTQHITLLGWQNNVYEWMQQWHMFALSSLWEGLPCSVVEARLSKLPVVAYDVGGIREVIFNDKNGFVITPGNWLELAERMLQIINTPTMHQKLSNYRDNLTTFDIQFMVEKHRTLYATLLNK